MWCQSAHPFRSFPPDFWICDTLKPPKCHPRVSRDNFFRLCQYPGKSEHVYQMWCQSVQPFGSFSRFLNFSTLKPPNAPWVTQCEFLFGPLPFQMNLHVRAKFGPDRTTGGDVYIRLEGYTHTDTHTPIRLIHEFSRVRQPLHCPETNNC